MKRLWKNLMTAMLLSLTLTITSFAGSWQSDAKGKWWKNDDGSFPANGWYWIDDNSDGIANSYYFNAEGYLLTDTTTPDGYTVDANGAWIVGNVVQTKTTAAAPAVQSDSSGQSQTAENSKSSKKSGQSASGISSSPYDGYTIVVNTSTKKYHVPGCKSVKSMKDKNKGYSSDAAYLESIGYSPCKNCH